MIINPSTPDIFYWRASVPLSKTSVHTTQQGQSPHAPDTTEDQWCCQKRERLWNNHKIITARLPPWVSPLGKAGICCSCTHSCSRGSLCMHSLTQPALHHPHGSWCWEGITNKNYLNTHLSQTVVFLRTQSQGKRFVFVLQSSSSTGTEHQELWLHESFVGYYSGSLYIVTANQPSINKNFILAQTVDIK